MNTRRICVWAGAVLVLSAGCQKNTEPKTGAVTSGSGGKSVALPPSQMPLSDSAIAPKSATGVASGNASATTPTNPAPLSPEQQPAAPQAGQAHKHPVLPPKGGSR